MRTTVLIVDDHDEFRASASALLEAEGFAVVGGVPGGAAALAAVERLRPDVVLLDVQLPDTDGFALARRLCAERWAPAVVLTSTRDAGDYGERLERSCALGFLAKDEVSAETLGRLLASRAGPPASGGRAGSG